MGNAGHKTAGTQSNPITEKGQKQAGNLAHHLNRRSIVPELVIHSKYVRTQQTMGPYAGNRKGLPVEEWDVHEFTYLSAAKYANTSEQQRLAPREEYWNMLDPDYRDGGNAESYNDLIVRVERMVRRLLQSPHNKIFVFSHGQFIKATWLTLMNEGLSGRLPTMAEFYDFTYSINFPNTGILRILFEEGNYWISPLCPPGIIWPEKLSSLAS